MTYRGLSPHWRDRKTILAAVLGIPLLGILVGLGLPFVQRLRTTMADTTPSITPAPIDGERAYGYLKQICELGPRPAGSVANAKQRQMVANHFTKYGAAVREQPFSGIDPRSGTKLDMVNLIGAWHPERTQRVLLGAHYDTRPFPDRETDPARRQTPYIGANDGASGVALLMEIAHHLNELPTTWGVDLVLFDGEDLVYSEVGEYCLGSKEFARIYSEAVEKSRVGPRYSAALVFDMVGDKNLALEQEQYSLSFTPRLVNEVWSVARKLKASAFRPRVGPAVNDDHLPLNNASIPAIDLIDFRPPPTWHMARDLPENCSAISLEQVGKVATAWLSMPRTHRH
jgi:glutaminyl-peptide cyclotransferase